MSNSTDTLGSVSLSFHNRFLQELPADPSDVIQPRQVLQACYSRVMPKKTAAPHTIAYSREVAEMIGLPLSFCESEGFAKVFSGNALLEGMEPYAVCYGGHQFGNWAGQLGDGRAISLGEVVSQGKSWELQLKGAGPTPYSRRADGLAVMRSSVREFLCSEAMHHLGVPTTRALSLVATGDQVMRDKLYDGNPALEPGAIVCRVAPSFLRFGNFELFASRGDDETLKMLVDFTIRHHFPALGEPSKQTYIKWIREVCRRTALMIVEWMRVGFVHGVMNTDNMSVLGLTIDYGPYGWLDHFDTNWTPNTTDASRKRYRYGQQPHVALWNLARFAEAIFPLIGETEPLEDAMELYLQVFADEQRKMMAKKLGFVRFEASEKGEDSDVSLVEDLLVLLEQVETDMTIFYRRLADVPISSFAEEEDSRSEEALVLPLLDAYYAPDEHSKEQIVRTASWLRRYIRRIRRDGTCDEERRQRMNAVNPKYVLRNYIAQLAIDEAEKGESSLVRELLELLRHPYDEQPAYEKYAQKRPEWARHRVGCSMLSCSS